jgi:hypothetical protein
MGAASLPKLIELIGIPLISLIQRVHFALLGQRLLRHSVGTASSGPDAHRTEFVPDPRGISRKSERLRLSWSPGTQDSPAVSEGLLSDRARVLAQAAKSLRPQMKRRWSTVDFVLGIVSIAVRVPGSLRQYPDALVIPDRLQVTAAGGYGLADLHA